jgi:2-polyprenyl-6-methoxyphenol hydroxylase-like FAD-dependent oxidoreductase
MNRSHCIVIGASIAGLLAASVLSESFHRVTVYDRDTLPDGPAPRRGAPQARQAHGLHARGAQALEELLPGFAGEMLAVGAVPADVQEDFRWYLDGHLARPANAGLSGIGISRQGLEWLIRSRAEKLPNVSITGRHAVAGLVATGGRVTGVRVLRTADRAGDPARAAAVTADLVVDAGGRGSRTPAWLAELGCRPARLARVQTGISYVTRHYERLPGQLDGICGAVAVPYPGHRRGCVLIAQEGGQWVLTLAGMAGQDVPADDAGMLAFAGSVAGPEFACVMRESPPLDEPVKTRFPGSVRRHYEAPGRVPAGLLVIGDALCSLNPVYGQGMTIAALEALALRRALDDGGRGAPGGGAGGRAAWGRGPWGGGYGASARRPSSERASAGREAGTAGWRGTDRLARAYFRAAGKLVSAAWAMSVAGDLSFPEVDGAHGLSGRLVDGYLARLRAAASLDAELGRAYLRVVNMIDSPASLLTPAMMARVARASRRLDRAPAGHSCQAVPVSRS